MLSHFLRAATKVKVNATYITNLGFNTAASSYTVTNASIGGAGLIVCVVHTEGGIAATLTSATIGGVSATINTQVTSPIGTVQVTTAIFSAVITSGSTATIVANYSGGPFARFGIGIYQVTGYSSVTPVTTATNSATSGTGLSATLNSLSVNDVVIAGYTTGSTNAITFTNITERYDNDIGGSNTRQAGGNAVVASSGNYTITTSNSNSSQGIALATAAWR
jgi:hypothetical protein